MAEKTDPTDAEVASTALASPRDPAIGARDVGAADFEAPIASGERYEALREIGRGGMGEIRACRDRHLGRVVAMKLLHDEHTPDRTMLASFLREGRVQAQLEHPAIVPVYDMGMLDGVPYLTMKRVGGTTLAEILERIDASDPDAVAHYTQRRLLGAFGAVCQAIDYAHTRGVVHRDLKPSNVMLGDFGEVYILDWGVAKVPEVVDSPGVVIGTPMYMAPEQLRGDSASVDARADVYALGAMLFEIVTLEPLNPHGNKRDTFDEAVRRADAGGAAPELLAACARAVAERREDRFASAGELFAAVDRFLAGEQDVERRRELSREHATTATSSTDREHAMREIGRALALDPDNVDALRTLVRLIGEPPAIVPAEVEKNLERTVEASILELVPVQFAAYASFVVLFPIVMWMGVRDWAVSMATSLLVFAAAATALLTLRAKEVGRRALFPSLIVSTLVIGFAATMFGPYVFVPTLAALNTLFYVIQLGRARAALTIAIGSSPIVVPAGLEAAGVLPPAYRFTDGTMQVLPWMHSMHATATPLFLFGCSVWAVILASIIALRFRESLTRAELRMQLHSWQLAKMLPPEAARPPDTH